MRHTASRSAPRLDVVLVERALAPSRERAQALVAAGLIEVDGATARSAAQRIGERAAIRVLGRDHPWASRGGLKLAGALDAFDIDCNGRVALDAGASTGGFTDVLIARGARLVYAVDVGWGQLDPRLARDARVCVLDRTNLRHLAHLPEEAPSLVTLDLSFISLRLVLGSVARLAPRADVVALFKPQFELGRECVGRGGIVRDGAAVERAVGDFVAWAGGAVGTAAPSAPIPSPIRGAKGNQEWLVHLRLGP